MAGASNLVSTLYESRPGESVLFKRAGGSSVSTAEALSTVRRMAQALYGFGVRPGDRVSCRLAKSVDAILLAHACLWSGAILHPLNESYTSHELAHLLADAQPRLFLVKSEEHDDLAPLAAQVGARIESFEPATFVSRATITGLPATALPANGAAVLLYTSGTTGKPKGALITHENLLTNARALAEVWQISPADTLFHALPIYHAHGLLTSINATMAGGGSILLLPSFEPESARAGLAGCTFMMGVPTHYARLVREAGLVGAIGKGFRLAISGSAPLPPTLAGEFYRLTGVPIIERYGSTEAAIITAVRPQEARERVGWVGQPLPGIEMRVAAEGIKSATGIGVVETRGPNIFSGYWRNEKETAAAFTADGWFVTGDVGEIDASGCLRLLGREKDIVISGGLNVYPAEVEDEIRNIPGIREAAVFGVAHPDFGEAVTAVIELAEESEFDEKLALTALKSRLAAYKTPKRIIPLAEIPRNQMGKILKGPLREMFCDLFSNQIETK